MSKPDDIPQDVWDAAGEAYWICNPMGERAVSHETIARAILAAKTEERRGIQTAVQDMAVPSDTSNSWQLGYRQCRIDAVAAIRKRGAV